MNLPNRTAILPLAVAAALAATACSSILGLGDFKDGPADAGSSGGTGGTGGSTQTDGGGTAGSGGGCTSNTDCPLGNVCSPSNTCVAGCAADHGCAGGGQCCSSTCADLSSDPKNCGACGHDCLGGKCSAGQCQPVAFADVNDTVSDLAVDDGYLYWTIFDSGAPAAIKRLPVGGGTPDVVAVVEYADALAFDSNNIYFVTTQTGHFVGKTSKASLGSFTKLYVPSVPNPLAGAVLVGNRLYFVIGDTATVGGSIESVGIDGTGEKTLLGTRPDGSDHRPLASDGTNIYWHDLVGGLQSIPAAQGNLTTLVANGVKGDLALSSNYVYFLQQFGTKWYVSRVPTSANNAVGTALSDGDSTISDFVVDGTTLIWSGGADGTVKSLALGSTQPTTLAPSAGAGVLAADAKSIYWWSSSDSKLYRLAR